MFFEPDNGPTAIIIVGPTASGKTALSLQAARHFQTSIISTDSRQCYREMNIGVAKPSPAELAQCPHYFINSHSIHEPVDTVVFEQEALTAAKQIFTEKKIALVAGGTGLYVKVFCEGIDDIPSPDQETRKRVQQAWTEGGLEQLRAWINEIDPAFMTSTGEKDNRVRIMRALEVKLFTGNSILDYRVGIKKQRPFNIRKIGIDWPREILYQRINARVEGMMTAGLLKEVESLFPHRHLKALQTVGYQELFRYLENDCTLEEAVEKIKQHTRNFAKRQMTWFRKDPEVQWSTFDNLAKDLGI